MPYMANGNPTSPLALGGPLATPTQPTNGGPQSPFLGMVNGMGMNFGMNAFPYMVS